MKQPWIRSAGFDSIWFLAPGILPVLILLCFPTFFSEQAASISTTSWILLVLLVDVSHVYSTVYRTYFNPAAKIKYPVILRAIPIISWILAVMLYSISSTLFWRCLAYLAVFHFVRQQYGFIRIYSRRENQPRSIRLLHNVTVYAVTLIPILIWHATGPKNFNWFMDGDFFYFDLPYLKNILEIVLFLLLAAYLFSEIYLWMKQKYFNVPRFLFMLGTAASWYLGIVIFNGDLAFTCLNVISHGIPYMALVWCTERKDAAGSPLLKLVFSKYGVLLFIGILFLFAYLEEGLWDSLVWREHTQVFSPFSSFEQITSATLLSFVIPLLSLPQIVHYVLDGFIWKMQKNRNDWIQ